MIFYFSLILPSRLLVINASDLLSTNSLNGSTTSTQDKHASEVATTGQVKSEDGRNKTELHLDWTVLVFGRQKIYLQNRHYGSTFLNENSKHHYAVARLDDNTFVKFGGSIDEQSKDDDIELAHSWKLRPKHLTNTTSIYDLTMGKEEPGPEMIPGRIGHAVVTIGKYEILSCGGEQCRPSSDGDESCSLALCQKLVKHGNHNFTMDAFPPMNHKRSRLVLVKVKDTIFAFGGYRSRLAYLDSIESFNDTTWKNETIKMDEIRAFAAGAVNDNDIYICGGVNPEERPSVIETCIRFSYAFNVLSRISTTLKLKYRSYSFSMFFIGNELVVFDTEGAVYALNFGRNEYLPSSGRYQFVYGAVFIPSEDCYEPELACYKNKPICQVPASYLLDKRATLSNKGCQRWSDNLPNDLSLKSFSGNELLRGHNFCRITNGEPVPYCYLMDSVGKEACFIACPQTATYSKVQSTRMGMMMTQSTQPSIPTKGTPTTTHTPITTSQTLLPTQAPTKTSQTPYTTQVPITTSQTPSTTQAPTTTSQTPYTTQVPITTSQTLSTTQAPTTTFQTPYTTQVPITTSQTPFTTQASTTTYQTPYTTQVPITTSQTPSTTQPPTTTSQTPYTTRMSITTSPASTTTNVPITTSHTTTYAQPPTSIQKSITSQAPTATRIPITTSQMPTITQALTIAAQTSYTHSSISTSKISTKTQAPSANASAPTRNSKTPTDTTHNQISSTQEPVAVAQSLPTTMQTLRVFAGSVKYTNETNIITIKKEMTAVTEENTGNDASSQLTTTSNNNPTSTNIATMEISKSVTAGNRPGTTVPSGHIRILKQSMDDLFAELDKQRVKLNLTFNQIGNTIGLTKAKETAEVVEAVNEAMELLLRRIKRQIPHKVALVMSGYAEMVTDILGLQNTILSDLFVGLTDGAAKAAESDNNLKKMMDQVKNRVGRDAKQTGKDAANNDISNNNGRETKKIVSALTTGLKAMNRKVRGKSATDDGGSNTAAIAITLLCVIIVVVGIVGCIFSKRRNNQMLLANDAKSHLIKTENMQDSLSREMTETTQSETEVTQSESSIRTLKTYTNTEKNEVHPENRPIFMTNYTDLP